MDGGRAEAGVADSDATAVRPMRADAQKNRQRILEAAAEVFAAKGVSVPIDLVAERAGVGVGTLYRHFPTKEALFESIVVEKIDDLIAAARLAADDPDPERALFNFVDLLATECAMKHDLFDALESAGVDVKSQCHESVMALQAAVDRLLERGVAEGAVRDDVDAEKVIGLVIGTCYGMRRMGADAATARQLIAIFCDGLRPSR